MVKSWRLPLREKPKGEEIISTPHDTDARYTRKGKQTVCGQKGFTTRSCEETNKTQFITDVEVSSVNNRRLHGASHGCRDVSRNQT